MQVGSGEPREATVLFLDLEGFTSLSERSRRTSSCARSTCSTRRSPIRWRRHDGVINQFQGDAILATFNAPRLNSDHASNAIRAALEIQAMLGARTFGDGLVLRARIGINTGVVIHGLIGTPDRLGYTVIGDEVNIAARLEALNKQYGTSIIVSEQTRERAGSGNFACVLLDEVQLRGRTTPTRIYRVEGA